jgi:hypothetical protein
MVDLNLIIADSEMQTSLLLEKVISSYSFVKSRIVTDPINLISKINEDTNTIIINPFSVNLDFTSELIFKIRKEYPNIVFVLFMDFDNLENNKYFYIGERRRFTHYYKLNKRTPLFLFESELINALFRCQNYLKNKGNKKKIENVNLEPEKIAIATEAKNLIANDKAVDALNRLSTYFENSNIDTHNQIILLLQKINNAEKSKTVDTIKLSEYITIKQQVALGTLEIINKEFSFS